MPGRLTTHVLDTAQGRPAAGIEIELWALGGDGARRLLKSVRTNVDGRTDGPLLADGELAAGVYELVFAVGVYYAANVAGTPVADTASTPATRPGGTPAPPFLDRVPIRFGVADPAAHYHVPLLMSPWAYTTYRGS